ncbi:hypothetical protein ScPMuIL_011771 [Solemya velum]
MNLCEIVQARLAPDEKCLVCIDGVDGSKLAVSLAIVERRGDRALFIFNNQRVPPVRGSDLSLQKVYPVDLDLKCLAAHEHNISIQSGKDNLKFDIPRNPSTHDFFVQLKLAKDLYSQSAGFGLPASFSWLDKYRDQLSKESNSNPFANDIFDPLGYMKINESGPKKTAASKSKSLILPKSGSNNSLNSLTVSRERSPHRKKSPSRTKVKSTIAKSASKESLDDLDSNSEIVETLGEIQKQFGLAVGVPPKENFKPGTARDTLIEYFLHDRESEFTDIQHLSVFCGTWNVNGKLPPDSILEWLSVDTEPPDIYVIGFQELDLSNQAYIFSDSQKEVVWQEKVEECLHPKGRYREVKLIRLVGVMLLVYIKEEYYSHVRHADCDMVATGILGVMGNKGGVSVRIQIHNTSICFVNCHLAAHQDEIERRNQDYRDIEFKLRFKQFLPPLTIREHDIVFWIGDMNYRISDLDINEIKDLIAASRYKELVMFDQLTKQLGKTDVFRGYSEQAIKFQPTYKYDTGTDDWDTSEKCRTPAWCDRVLYKGRGIEPKVYRFHPVLKISDHKPVSSLFKVEIKVVDPKRCKKVYEDVNKMLDRLENDYLPQVELDHREFFFGEVKFIESQQKDLTVMNTGQVPVTYEFINKLDDRNFSKPWLKVGPNKSVIVPGNKVVISMEVYIDKNNVGDLNSGKDTLSDILVLHLHGGKDFFISFLFLLLNDVSTVYGTYVPSSFGCSVEALVQMHGPIREVPVATLLDLEQPGSLSKVDVAATGGRLYSVPKEIWRMVDHIWRYGRHQDDLFQQPGLDMEVQQIRDCLDTGSPDLLPGSIHSVAEALLLFLESLPEPVIPFPFYQSCLECVNNYLLCKQIILKIPECHRNLFHYLISFFRELLSNAEHNNLSIKSLASMVGEIILRAPPSMSSNASRQLRKSEDLKRAAFVYHFLTSEDYDE